MTPSHSCNTPISRFLREDLNADDPGERIKLGLEENSEGEVSSRVQEFFPVPGTLLGFARTRQASYFVTQ